MMVMLLMMAATYISVLPRYGQGWIDHITTRISLTTAAAMPALTVSSPSKSELKLAALQPEQPPQPSQEEHWKRQQHDKADGAGMEEQDESDGAAASTPAVTESKKQHGQAQQEEKEEEVAVLVTETETAKEEQDAGVPPAVEPTTKAVPAKAVLAVTDGEVKVGAEVKKEERGATVAADAGEKADSKKEEGKIEK
jgi:hypothetical protein